MPQVDRAIIKRRAEELRGDVSAVRTDWLRSLLGTPQRVLSERDEAGYSENFARVTLPEGTQAGRLVEIVPTEIRQGALA